MSGGLSAMLDALDDRQGLQRIRAFAPIPGSLRWMSVALQLADAVIAEKIKTGWKPA